MSATLVLISVFAVFLPALILPGQDFVAVVRTALTRGLSAALLWYASVSRLMASAAVRTLVGSAGHWVERTAGLRFIAVGGRILVDARQPLTP